MSTGRHGVIKIERLEEFSQFDEIIDVRTPLEYAEDHIPGALNAPVLSNDERVIIGTMYKQVSPYEATRVGAAWVALTSRFGPAGFVGTVTAGQVAVASSGGRLLSPGWPSPAGRC